MAHTAALPMLMAESGLAHYLDEIRRFPLLAPQDEYTLAKRAREHDDRDAAHRLVTSHLRLVAKIAMGYRGYGLPIGEIVSEGNIGLMQAVKRFEPDMGFRLATYAMWWIKAAIQEYILRSWSLVKMGSTASQRKLFFSLRKVKNRISAFEEGDLRPEHVKLIAERLGVPEQDVIAMNRRLGGDVRSTRRSAPTAIPANGRTGWPTRRRARRRVLAESEELDNRRTRCARRSPCSATASAASSRRADSPMSRARSSSSPRNSAFRASGCGRSRCAPTRRCREPSGTGSPPWHGRKPHDSPSAASPVRLLGVGRLL